MSCPCLGTKLVLFSSHHVDVLTKNVRGVTNWSFEKNGTIVQS